MTKKEHRPDVLFVGHRDNEGNLRLTPLPRNERMLLDPDLVRYVLDFGEYKGTSSTITPAEIAALLAEYRAKQGDMPSIGYTVADDSEGDSDDE